MLILSHKSVDRLLLRSLSDLYFKTSAKMIKSITREFMTVIGIDLLNVIYVE